MHFYIIVFLVYSSLSRGIGDIKLPITQQVKDAELEKSMKIITSKVDIKPLQGALWELQKAAFKQIVLQQAEYYMEGMDNHTQAQAEKTTLYIIDEVFAAYEYLPEDQQKNVREFTKQLIIDWVTMDKEKKQKAEQNFRQFQNFEIEQQQSLLQSISDSTVQDIINNRMNLTQFLDQIDQTIQNIPTNTITNWSIPQIHQNTTYSTNELHDLESYLNISKEFKDELDYYNVDKFQTDFSEFLRKDTGLNKTEAQSVEDQFRISTDMPPQLEEHADDDNSTRVLWIEFGLVSLVLGLVGGLLWRRSQIIRANNDRIQL